MGRTRKTAHASLGASLVRKKKPQWDRSTNCEHPEILTENTTNALKSVTEENAYDEFIATATLANKEFTAEKLNVKFVAMSTSAPTEDGGQDDDRITDADKHLVVVPRRPKWTREMTAEELDSAERDAFLEWRRAMAHLQNKEGITPFERNIEVWRQLWRVVERSDVIVQIVDARNPLLYRCEDLEKYVKEMGKRNILLVNKADFLTLDQRKYWTQYFNSISLPHAFYSAATVAEKLKEVSEHQKEGQSDYEDEDDDDEIISENEQGEILNQPQPNEVDESSNNILNREELIDFLRSFKKDKGNDESGEEIFAVGLVGYPNVGKSSTINSLMDAKKTSVSSTPGKTKHFQTLFLEEDILLCDCPGLVMPAVGGSKGEMVLGGILPIDQLTSYHSATELLVDRIPLVTLERKYGVTLPKNYNHEEFLTAYAALRGFMTVRGIPDCSRASRIVLKDYVNGKLCYCQPPPNVTAEDFCPTPDFGVSAVREDNQPRENRRPVGQKVRMEKALDRQFFNPSGSAAHVKGTQLIASGISSSASSSSSQALDGKPWKKHGNKGKKEKLRRLYRHLDVE